MNWDERIVAISVHPDSATAHEVEQLAAELMAARRDRQALLAALKHAIGILEGMDVDALGEVGTSEDSWPLRDEYLYRFKTVIAQAAQR